MYTNEELAFILYNNRSVNGVVKNFLPNLDPVKLIKLESRLQKSKSLFENDKRMVEVSTKDLLVSADDIILKPEDLGSLTDLILQNIGNFSDEEYLYLTNRGFGDSTILEWKLLGLSSIKRKKDLITIGATCHPVLSKIFDDGIGSGGIIIPLFENGILVNTAIRKINSHKSLKYSLACPDVPVWGLNKVEQGDDIWLTEGIFDMMALIKLEKKSVSCSSAMWTGIQLYKILEKYPNSITIFSDKDQVGLRTSAILKDFFLSYNIPTRILISRVAKDPAEHYFEKYQDSSRFEEINVNHEMLDNFRDESFNFIHYLKNRKF